MRLSTATSHTSLWVRPFGVTYPATGCSRHSRATPPGVSVNQVCDPLTYRSTGSPSCSAKASTSSGRMRQTAEAVRDTPLTLPIRLTPFGPGTGGTPSPERFATLTVGKPLRVEAGMVGTPGRPLGDGALL